MSDWSVVITVTRKSTGITPSLQDGRLSKHKIDLIFLYVVSHKTRALLQMIFCFRIKHLHALLAGASNLQDLCMYLKICIFISWEDFRFFEALAYFSVNICGAFSESQENNKQIALELLDFISSTQRLKVSFGFKKHMWMSQSK